MKIVVYNKLSKIKYYSPNKVLLGFHLYITVAYEALAQLYIGYNI